MLYNKQEGKWDTSEGNNHNLTYLGKGVFSFIEYFASFVHKCVLVKIYNQNNDDIVTLVDRVHYFLFKWESCLTILCEMWLIAL